jgi:predicted phage terminase large subunit-like protein
VQRIIEEHQDLLGYKLTSDAAGDWRTSNKGRYRAVGVGTAVPGYRATLILIDDPVRGIEAAQSETDRLRVQVWFENDIRPRRIPGTAIVIVSTRWHEDDLAGHLLSSAEAPDWTNIVLRAIAEDDDPLGRKPGTPLWNDDEYGYGNDILAIQARTEKNGQSALWYAQYQGSPRAPEGNLFKRDNLTTHDMLPGRILQTCRAWDLAASNDKGDYTASVKLAMVLNETTLQTNWIIVDVTRDRLGPECVEALVLRTAQTDGHACLIFLPEDPGQAGKSQSAAYARLLIGYPIFVQRMTGPKEVRAAAAAAQFNLGNIGIVKAPWNAAFLDELLGFPRARHDDQVDALALAFDKLAVEGLGEWALM